MRWLYELIYSLFIRGAKVIFQLLIEMQMYLNRIE